jgi:hypothetical protein
MDGNDPFLTWAKMLQQKDGAEKRLIARSYERLFAEAVNAVKWASRFTTDRFALYEVPASMLGLVPYDRTVARDYIIRRFIALGFRVVISDPTRPFQLLMSWFEVVPNLDAGLVVSAASGGGAEDAKKGERRRRKRTRTEEDEDESDTEVESADEGGSRRRPEGSRHRKGKGSESKTDLFNFFRLIADPSKIIARSRAR